MSANPALLLCAAAGGVNFLVMAGQKREARLRAR
jgi:hypothetical protein